MATGGRLGAPSSWKASSSSAAGATRFASGQSRQSQVGFASLEAKAAVTIGFRALVALVALAATPALADIYVWRDAAGVSHYTNALELVPPEYRANAYTVAKDWNRAEPPPEPPAAERPANVSAPPAPPPPAPAAEGQQSRQVYDDGYAAGLRAAAVAAPEPERRSIVQQNLQIAPPEVRERLIPMGPVIVQRGPRPEPTPGEPFAPGQSLPYVRGPAGPPPVSFTR
jgi:hypothetical protein